MMKITAIPKLSHVFHPEDAIMSTTSLPFFPAHCVRTKLFHLLCDCLMAAMAVGPSFERVRMMSFPE